MAILPNSPETLLEKLFSIFPEFQSTYTVPNDGETPTFGDVLIDFTPFFGERINSFSKNQLQEFAELVNAAVAEDGLLENILGTFLLEHLHQIGACRVFMPYLSKAACEKTHA